MLGDMMREKMRVAIHDRFGRLKLETMPKPTIEPNELLLEVRACGARAQSLIYVLM
jgi:D-arabinose 1-dehydrogenase-like Zn-dependent alcohol dehydrogenase